MQEIQLAAEHMEELPESVDNGDYILLQGIASRICSFPPWLARQHILTLTDPGELVLDQFSGKGTALLEALGQNRVALGVDVAPDAFILSSAKTYPLTYPEVLETLARIYRLVDHGSSDHVLTGRLGSVTRQASIFYHPRTFRELRCFIEACLYLRKRTSGDRLRELRFVQAILLGLLHGHRNEALSLPCSHAYSMSPAYVRKKRLEDESRVRRGLKAKYPIAYRNLWECLESRALQICPSSSTVARIRSLCGRVWYGSALTFPKEPEFEGRVTLCLTSPPYLDRQRYAKDNWIRLWALGYDHRTVNRRMHGFISGSLSKYLDHLELVLLKTSRLLRVGGHLVLIVGDVKTDLKAKPIVNLGTEIVRRTRQMSRKYDDFHMVHLGTRRDDVPAGRRSSNSFWSSQAGTKIDRIVCFRRE